MIKLTNNKKTLEDAVALNGENFQLNKLVEECAEITKEIVKYQNGFGSHTRIGQELVDLYVTADIIKAHLTRTDAKYANFFKTEYAAKIAFIADYLAKKK